MDAQIFTRDGKPDFVVLPYADYVRLVEQAKMVYGSDFWMGETLSQAPAPGNQGISAPYLSQLEKPSAKDLAW
jgi:hypothetical protein